VAVGADQPGKGEADFDFADPVRAEAVDVAELVLLVQLDHVPDRGARPGLPARRLASSLVRIGGRVIAGFCPLSVTGLAGCAVPAAM